MFLCACDVFPCCLSQEVEPSTPPRLEDLESRFEFKLCTRADMLKGNGHGIWGISSSS